uniref:olfactory receptor 7C1-like n=1 Tax=Myxine glutinosa TaxID=7769 RepID=UPI00358F492A
MVIMWCFLVLVLIVVLLNVTVITACALRRFDKPMVRYIAVTSMVDTYWGAFGMGSYTYNITVGPRFMFFADCVSQMFFRHVFLLGQFLMITVMYVDRHCAVFWPYTYATWTARRNGTSETLTLVWCVAVLFALVFPVAATRLSFCTDPVVIKGTSCIYGVFSKAACNDRFLQNTLTACVLYFFMGQSALVVVYLTWCILRMCRRAI